MDSSERAIYSGGSRHLHLRGTHVVFFSQLLCICEALADFGGLQLGHHSKRNIDEIVSNNRYDPRDAHLQTCQVKFYQRNVCEFQNKIAVQQTKQKTTRYNSKKINQSKTKTEGKRFEKEKACGNSIAKNKDGDQVYETRHIDGNLEEFDKLRSTDLESGFNFSSELVCPYLSIRSRIADETTQSTASCRTNPINQSECEFINTYLGQPREILPRICPQKKTAINICWFKKRSRSSIQDTAGLQCDIGMCSDGVVYLGVFDVILGRVMPDDDWLWFANETSLVKAISDLMTKNYSNHFRFCFLGCILKGHPNSRTKQLLVFPPVIKHCTKTSAPQLNINIVVQDSISRHQFYRTLPKTVKNLREIVHDPSIDATVLDFEKYQSYDSSTHSNIKKLFAGENAARNRTYVTRTIKEFYETFKSASYETLFQEDACWFAGFASLLRPKSWNTTAENDTRNLWKEFYGYMKENLMPSVDSFGVGFSSCKILQDLGDANIFNGETLLTICLDGHPLSYYFLNAVQDLFEAYKNNSCPIFSYSHLNTGHEHTGQRITQDDEYLANFVKTMATHHRSTLTILLSDHGGKTTEYATRTVPGLKEIYKPFMFIIVPRHAAKILGNERMGNLIRNQNRLVALEDLSLALYDVVRGFDENNTKKKATNFGTSDAKEARKSENTRNFDGKGLFGNISADRNCTQLNLSADAVCLCEGEDVEAVMDPLFLDFLASIAVGHLNNIIQSQYNSRSLNSNLANGKIAASKYIDKETRSANGMLKDIENGTVASNQFQSLGGYGNCLRYILKRVERYRSKVIGEERIHTFNVLVNTVPATGDREEIFEMTVGHHLTDINGVKVLKITRLSRYSVFNVCTDADVEPDLCTCNAGSNPHPAKYLWDLLGYYMFTTSSQIDKLEHPCLYLITTKRERFLKLEKGRDAFLAHEIVNACDKIFNVTLSDGSLVRQPFILSRTLPFSTVVYPNAAHHLISAFCGLPHGEFVASFKVDVVHA